MDNKKEVTVGGAALRIRESGELAFPLKKKRKNIMVLIAVVLATVVVLALAFTSDFDSFADKLAGFAANIGFGHSKRPDNGGIVDLTNDEESEAVTESDCESESKADTETESVDETELTDSTPSVPQLFTEVDLSEAEMGELYIYNDTDISPDVAALYYESVSFEISHLPTAPTVLVIHSATSSVYLDSEHHDLDPGYKGLRSVVSVGDKISSELNSKGVFTVHIAAIHDGEGNIYKNSADTIKTMLKIYPSIKYVIDVGRQDIVGSEGEALKTVAPSGEAQIKISVSLWGSGDGREDNMALALKLRGVLNSDGKRLCEPVLLTEEQYNSAMSRYYLKVDIGATGNTTREAVNAGVCFADALIKVIDDN